MATLNHQVWINASPEVVYDAISTAEGLGKWWSPHETTETDGVVVLSHDPGPTHGVVKLMVVEATPNSRVEWECISRHPKSSPASGWTGTRVAFDISERGNIASMTGIGNDGDPMTVLDFRHSGWDENSEYLGFCNFAWGFVLNLLKEHCESKSPETAQS